MYKRYICVKGFWQQPSSRLLYLRIGGGRKLHRVEYWWWYPGMRLRNIFSGVLALLCGCGNIPDESIVGAEKTLRRPGRHIVVVNIKQNPSNLIFILEKYTTHIARVIFPSQAEIRIRVTGPCFLSWSPVTACRSILVQAGRSSWRISRTWFCITMGIIIKIRFKAAYKIHLHTWQGNNAEVVHVSYIWRKVCSTRNCNLAFDGWTYHNKFMSIRIEDVFWVVL